MAGPGGVSVGRASIRILPDTSAFGRSLERYVQRIEKTLRIQIPTSADVSGFNDDLDRIRQQQQRAPVDVPVKPVQLDNFARQIKAEAERLARTVELSIPVTADGEQMRRKITAQVAGLSRLLEVKVPLDVGNAAAFRAQVLAQLGEVEALAKAADPTVKLRVDVNKSQLREIENVGGRLAGLQRIATDAARGIGSVFDGIGNGATSAITGVAGLAAKLPVIPALLAAAAPLAADLAASLGPSLLVAVPAMVGAGAALGVMALSMDKLKGAFKPITDGFLGMRNAIGDVLTKGVRPLTEEFAKTALPVIQAGLSGIARTMNGFLRDFLTWAGSAPTVRLIGQVLDGVNAAMKPLAGAAQAFADAVLRIAKDAAPGLKILTGAIRDLALRFDNFIKSKDKDGSLTKTISDSVQSALDLIGALTHLGKAVGGLFTDIGKGSTSSLTDGIQGIADAIDKFNKNGGGKEVHDFLVQVGQAIKDYFTSGDFKKTTDDLKTFASNARDLTADIKGLADSLKGAKGWFDSLTGSDLGASFMQAITPVRTLLDLVNGIAAVGPGLWDGVKAATSEAWAAVSAAVSGAWASITGAVTSGVASAGAAVSSGWASITGSISGGANQAWSAVSAAWGSITSATATAWAAVSGTVAGWWAAITATVSGRSAAASGLVVSAWGRVTSATSTAWAAASGAVSSWLSVIVSTVSARASQAWSAVSLWFSRIPGTVGDAFQRAYSGAVTWIENLIAKVASMGSQIASTVAGFGSLLFNAGAQLIQGLINGITSKIGAVTGAISGIASRIRGYFPGSPVREGPLVSWNNGGAGKRLVDLLVTGLADTSGVESAMASLAGKVAAPIEASVFASAQDAAGGLAAGGVVVNVTNPVPETASESTTRILRRLAVFGPAALPATA